MFLFYLFLSLQEVKPWKNSIHVLNVIKFLTLQGNPLFPNLSCSSFVTCKTYRLSHVKHSKFLSSLSHKNWGNQFGAFLNLFPQPFKWSFFFYFKILFANKAQYIHINRELFTQTRHIFILYAKRANLYILRHSVLTRCTNKNLCILRNQ